MERIADPLYGYNRTVLFDLVDLPGTGTNYFAIKDNGTCAAYACAAAYFRSGKSKTTKYGCQRILFRIADEHTVSTVDVQCHFLQIHNNCLRFNNINPNCTTTLETNKKSFPSLGKDRK